MSNIVKKISQNIKQLFSARRTVDFLICGTQKGGKSALDAYIREHPEICMADVKEVHYFDSEIHFANGNPDYSKYHFFSTRQNIIKLWENLRQYICIGIMLQKEFMNTTQI